MYLTCSHLGNLKNVTRIHFLEIQLVALRKYVYDTK